jgi:membrane fusion protein (multidrug efflux system)
MGGKGRDRGENIMKGKPLLTKAKEIFLQKMPTILTMLFLLILVGTIVGLSGTIKAEKKSIAAEKMGAVAAERPPVNVVLLDVNPTTLEDRINLPGVVEPWEKLSVLSKIHGTVIKVEVSEGDKVAKGQVIARIDPADFQIAVDSARATYELAEANYKRRVTLYEEGIVPRADIDSLEAQVKTSKAALENAELMLSRCMIKAPISGVIRRLDATEGLLLGVSDPVAEILQVDRVKAVVGIPESDVALVKNIKEVNLTIQALDNREVVGRNHFLASSPENGARLYRLELAIENKDNLIMPGMFVRAQLVKRVISDTVAVPLFTVIKREDQKFVFVEEDGVAKKHPVELGIMEDWLVQITKGLSPGEKVVVEGHRDIDDGFKLRTVRVIDDLGEALL